jgi:lysophospholipase L1-like esterase
MAHGNNPRQSSLVPLPRAFAVFGYTVFMLVAICVLLECGFRSARYLEGRHRLSKSGLQGHCRGLGGGRCEGSYDSYWMDTLSSSPSFDGEIWAEEFWRDERHCAGLPVEYSPFLLWKRSECHSRYVNIDRDGWFTLRRTIQPEACLSSPRKTTVWMFGGSTVQGPGNPDLATIPSYLAAALTRKTGECVEVRNFGVSGYVGNQELIALMELLRSGRKPDVVVFYDGYNDGHAGVYSPGIPEAHLDLVPIKRKLESSSAPLRQLLERSYSVRGLRALLRASGWSRSESLLTVDAQDHIVSEELTDDNLAKRAKATLDHYERNLQAVRRLGEQYGFTAYFFWQPGSQYGKKRFVPYEQRALADPEIVDPSLRRALQFAYREAEARAASGGFIYLGDIFDSEAGPIYLDDVHLGPRGNQLAAEAIAASIQLPRPQP